MGDKGKKGKKAAAAAAAPASAPAAAPPSPPAADEPGDKKDQEDKEIKKKPKSVQPKDEVGTRKGCRRYMWEFKKGNREFWVIGHAEVKILSLVSWAGTPGRRPNHEKRVKEQAPEGLQKGSRVGESPLR